MNFENEIPEEEEGTEAYIPFETVPGAPSWRSDQDIRRDIETSLFYDRAIRSYQVKVDVQGGLVTLSGTVDSDAEKLKAEEDTRVIPGVTAVCNNLAVHPAT